MPVKIRGGVKDRNISFTTDVSLAGALDLNWRMPGDADWSLHLPIFAGVGIVEIEPGQSKLEKSETRPAFSSGFGLGISTSHGAAGLLMGFDLINKNYERGGSIAWDYQGLPWLGVSFGATFGTQTGDREPKQ